VETVEFYRKKSGILLGAVPAALSRPEGDKVRLREVTPALVDDYIIMRRNDGVVDSTIQKELTTWRASMRLAKRRRLWRGDLEECFPKFGADYQPRERWLHWSEVLPLRAAFIRPRKLRGGHEGPEHGHALWAIAAFMVATSCEWSAAWRARPEDVDKRDDLAWFVHVRGTKKKTRDRHVPIVHLPFAMLLDDALACADGTHGLFLNREGSFRHRLAEACERAGIAHLSPNDLRRTHGKWLRLAGVTPANIATSLGHADARMAERVYAKASARELASVQRAELAASGLLMGSGPAQNDQTGPNPTTPHDEKTP
jgi:integrase